MRRSSPTPPARDLYALTARLVTKDGKPIPRVINPTPVSYDQGRKDTFTVTDIPNASVHPVVATLQLVTQHAYWYVDDSVKLSRIDLERAAQGFEETIYPRVTRVFGPELVPGIDNDVHLTILHTPLNGVAGYFSAVDEYPLQVHPQSNQREMVYIDTSALPLGSNSYLGTLAHEFTHAIQFRVDPYQDSWFNEGLAEYGKRLAGYTPSFQGAFFSGPPVSFAVWPLDLASTAPYYGAASLLMDYMAQQFGAQTMGTLMQQPAKGVGAIQQYLAEVGAGRTFREVFADWLVANYLDDPQGGVYSYPKEAISGFQPTSLKVGTSASYSVPQYAGRYYSLPVGEAVKVSFKGQPQTLLITDAPPSGTHCWWSNRGDTIDSTLTGRFDLPVGKELSLEYSLWTDIEKGWDFAYVEASTDAGQTWDLLQGRRTVPPDSLHNAFGHGYTGNSGGWVKDQVDLTPYAGRSVMLRFEYVTDDALHGTGLCLDDITLAGAGFFDNAESDLGAWDSEGFIRTTYQAPQEYLLRLVQVNADGARVTSVPIGLEATGAFSLPGLGADTAVLIVAAMSNATMQPASFQLQVATP